MLCFSSKKSAVYPGYSGIGSNPSQRRSTELVHSHAPPISDWPASEPPLPVTGVGCQCLKPTLWEGASRSMKRCFCCCWGLEEELPALLLLLLPASEEEEPGGVAGGEISTPLLQRWLMRPGLANEILARV